MRIIVNNVKSKIETDNKKIIETLVEFFKVTIPGSQYMRRSYYFDGKKKFISDAGYFKSGLLDLVVAACSKIGITPEIVDKRVSPCSPEINFVNDKFTPYEYQKSAVINALESKTAVIESPTGSGKTLLIALVIKALEGQLITVLFNSTHILKQTYDFLKTFGIKDLGINFGGEFVNGRVMLSTVQSIEKILDPYVGDSTVLIIDEVHEFCKGKVTLAAIESFPKAFYRFGFTATVPKEKIYKLNLIGALGKIINVRSTKQLIEDKKLTKPLIKSISVVYPIEDLDISYTMDYASIYKKYVIEDTYKHQLVKNLVEEIHKSEKDTKTLILVKSLEHLAALKALIKDSITIEGSDIVSDRYEAITKFLNSPNSVIIGTKVMQTGISIDEITHFINATEIKSEIATIQSLGRALRLHESKPQVYVCDIGTTNIRYLEDHKNKRLSTYKKEKHEVKTHDVNKGT